MRGARRLVIYGLRDNIVRPLPESHLPSSVYAFSLASLAQEAPLRLLVVDAGNMPHAGADSPASSGLSISLAGLVQPFSLASRLAGPEKLVMEVVSLEAFLAAEDGIGYRHITLVASDHVLPSLPSLPSLPAEKLRLLIERSQRSLAWGAVGAAVLWLAKSGVMEGVRTALPWGLYPEVDETAEHAILTPNLFEIDGNRLTCCGGTASIDFSLTLIAELFGADLQASVREMLCVDRVRSAGERQRAAPQARFGVLQPKLSEAVSLMEANVEEPLSTDDIAALVGISRRQLERQFKQFLGSVPSRYYLEMRLQRARQLLLDSSHSIVQIGLMCGFSSGSHFSTAYGTLFGITPREERQRKLHSRA
jgi:AraC family transcriptional regulator, L-arginine-responsive activator